jgi:hypothetical protein
MPEPDLARVLRLGRRRSRQDTEMDSKSKEDFVVLSYAIIAHVDCRLVHCHGLLIIIPLDLRRKTIANESKSRGCLIVVRIVMSPGA